MGWQNYPADKSWTGRGGLTAGGAVFFFVCSLLLVLSFRVVLPALMALSGLFLIPVIFIATTGPVISRINLYRLRTGRIIVGREETLLLSSQKRTLCTVEVKRRGKRSDLRFPLFDISYRLDLAWFHRNSRQIWRRWESTVPLDGRDGVVLEIDRSGLIRGDYTGRDGFIISDWFGFFRFSLVSSRPLSVKVTPRQGHHAPRFTPSPQAEGVSSFVSLPSEEEMVENRPYFPGDDPRKINWKQFARFQDLFVRTAHDPLPNNKWVLCLLSGEGCALEDLDRSCRFYLGLCRFLEERGCEVYTLLPGSAEMGLADYTLLPSVAPGDTLPPPVRSPGHVIMVGCSRSHEETLWRRQAREQGIPFTLFDGEWREEE